MGRIGRERYGEKELQRNSGSERVRVRKGNKRRGMSNKPA